MEKHVVVWIEFGAILVGVGAFVCCMFHLLLELRWLDREERMNKVLIELKRPPIIHAFETKADLDSEVGEFRRVPFT